LIASLLLDIISKDDKHKPVFNPSLIAKLRPEVLESKECEPLLLKSHKLAAEKGLPYFANLCAKGQKQASYTATGCRFATDWKKDWELDTLQTGNIDSLIINLPRVSYEARGNQTQFFTLLDEQLEMALRALEIKYQTIKRRSLEGVPPFLMQKADGDYYFRLQNVTRLVSFVGLNETAQSFLGKAIHEDNNALDFAEKIANHLNHNIKKHAKKPETRTLLSMVPNTDAAKRLAELDVESYGWAKVHAQGAREQPFYTDLVAVPLTSEVSWEDRLNIEGKFHRTAPGSHLAIIQLGDSEVDADSLLSATRKIVSTFAVRLYAYNRHLSYCASCQKTFLGYWQSAHHVDQSICFLVLAACQPDICHRLFGTLQDAPL